MILQGYVRLSMSLSWTFLFMVYPTRSVGLKVFFLAMVILNLFYAEANLRFVKRLIDHKNHLVNIRNASMVLRQQYDELKLATKNGNINNFDDHVRMLIQDPVEVNKISSKVMRTRIMLHDRWAYLGDLTSLKSVGENQYELVTNVPYDVQAKIRHEVIYALTGLGQWNSPVIPLEIYMEPVDVRIRFIGWDKDEMKFDLTVEDN